MDITDEEFENIIKNLTVRQKKLLRVIKESGELDGLVEMMEKIKLEEKESQEEYSRPSETKSTAPSSPIDQELAASTGLSPDQISAILDEA